MTDELTIDFNGQGGQRKAFRARIRGLEAFVKERELTLSVKDISATGCSLNNEGQHFVVGDDFQMDLRINKKLFLAGIKTRVVRQLPDNGLGCSFEELDRRQEAWLDKLILEVQKRQIAMKKASVSDDDLEK